MQKLFYHFTLLLLLACVGCQSAVTSAQDSTKWNFKDHQNQASIVIAQNPSRTVKLAAQELQQHIEKMAGVKLPITTTPSDDKSLRLYVGQSAFTDQLGIRTDDLADGAFRINAAENAVVLIGKDSDFVPPEIWAVNHASIPAMLEKWDQRTGNTWDNAVGGSLHRKYSREMKLWSFDQRGSLNAVYQFLRDQGVEWYMPGELGILIPQQDYLLLPKADSTHRPQFGLRYQHHSFFALAKPVDILWYMRLGLNNASQAVGDPLNHSHGMTEVIARDEMKTAHPDYYAIWGGKRMNQDHPKPCLSSEGLFKENVRYLQAIFDAYDLPMASLFPPDGYGSVCQCDLCKDKGTPKRGWQGSMSDYVWDYVNRVAQELYKSHPDKKISCFAYGTYHLPPEKIRKLSPNLVIGIVQPRRLFSDAARKQEQYQIRKQWLNLATDDKLFIWDHYPFTMPGRPAQGIPQYFPHLIAQDLKSLQNISYGELLETAIDLRNGYGIDSPIFNHLNIFVTARLYWDVDQDVDALLDTYYKRFYGPASAQMKAFVDYCETNTDKLRSDVTTINELLELADDVHEHTGPDSPYRQRVDLLIDYLKPIRDLRDRLAVGRKNMPEALAIKANITPDDITIDGKFDEPVWKEHKRYYGLSEIQTGQSPAFATSFRMLWANDALYLAIECKDPDTTKLNIATTKNNDGSIFNGDTIELLIETQSHSYYQIVINPAGALTDLDRISGINSDWSSEAQVAAHIEDGQWSVEIKLPIADSQAGVIDPLHQIVGQIPTQLYPWYFNLCRQRIRENGTEMSAFSPAGKNSFHELLKFGKLKTH